MWQEKRPERRRGYNVEKGRREERREIWETPGSVHFRLFQYPFARPSSESASRHLKVE